MFVRVEVADEVHRGRSEFWLLGLLLDWDWRVCSRTVCLSSQGGLYSFDSSVWWGCNDCLGVELLKDLLDFTDTFKSILLKLPFGEFKSLPIIVELSFLAAASFLS